MIVVWHSKIATDPVLRKQAWLSYRREIPERPVFEMALGAAFQNAAVQIPLSPDLFPHITLDRVWLQPVQIVETVFVSS